MAREVIMPKLGLTMEEGVINKWFVREGERVEKGDPLFEVATDKVNMEVESPASGVVLKILYPEGATVPITEVVAYIGEEGEEVPVPGKKAPGEQPEAGERVAGEQVMTQKTETGTETAKERIKASPLARKLAQEYGIDLATITGTGPGGRIVKEDVERAKRALEEAKKQEIPVVEEAPVTEEVKGKVVPLSRMRQIIAQRMVESARTKPHFFVFQEILAEELVKMRERLLPLVEKETGLRVSYTDILVKVVAKALERYPLLYASFTEEGIVFHEHVNIGVAVALEDGLIVPVVKEVERKSIAQITRELHDLVERAKAGKLTPEEISGGTFTISNLGMFGVDAFTAIINPPESAILACGAIKKKPVFDGKDIVPLAVMELVLSCDHRIVDGAVAAQFMQFLKTLLEEPFALLL
ncbi:2-oxo acid dehydrogenase subunit E2 [Candidatus Caldatribacterium saccharofermentans]|uniref:Dihydrolipoamide acetyltransferase component of pyruvate dehydrogenase complex n=1 Tax=Candidatus Caldatribacterium saccharofermentans TaxID=1454753 RepID=A0A7V4WMF0_9BACT